MRKPSRRANLYYCGRGLRRNGNSTSKRSISSWYCSSVKCANRSSCKIPYFPQELHSRYPLDAADKQKRMRAWLGSNFSFIHNSFTLGNGDDRVWFNQRRGSFVPWRKTQTDWPARIARDYWLLVSVKCQGKVHVISLEKGWNDETDV